MGEELTENTGPLEPGPSEVSGEAFEPGKPGAPDRWRSKLRSRGEMLRYLRSSERWYGAEGYGSERRRTRA